MRASSIVRGVALVGVLLALAGTRGGTPGAEARIVIDGGVGDWPAETRLEADGRDVYVRFSVAEPITLQAAPYSVAVLVDADGDPATGPGLPTRAGRVGAGSDLAIVFSPSSAPGGEGVAVSLLGGEGVVGGRGRGATHGDLDLVFAPVFAAREFELRFSRRVRGHPDLAQALAAGTISVEVVGVDRSGTVLWSKALGAVDLPDLAPPGPRMDDRLPARPAGALRIVSWNVLFATPERRPAPFARILRALDPDVVLLQEWEGVAAGLRAWFETHVGGTWYALDSEGWGVAVVARGPLRRLGPARVERPPEAPPDTFRPDRALRLAAAIVETRLGSGVVASVHLKCCGAAGSPRDRARIAEAERIHDTLSAALAGLGDSRPGWTVIGGDLNLVGSDVPLRVLRHGLRRDGADLSVVRARVLGDRALYTWRRAGQRYAPGRLDYLLYDGAEVVHAFVVDTERWPAAALLAAGLEVRDSAASDHLALVADLRPAVTASAKREE